ncbi:MAG: acyl-CoA/acyl-ACP dehydrogenase [Anaerolineae bacterium]|nr:acyl-CoA/acyl-ACP dehydrogenase [Anaerolineae bacterium]
MTHFVNDPQFGEIIDFEHLMEELQGSYDQLFPDFNMVGAVQVGSKAYDDQPSYMVAGGASILGYSMLLAAEEYELAQELKGKLFTLGWTEEHTGTDLLSLTTAATPMADDPTGRKYHIKGRKWIINNSYHAEYHTILAKIDPTQDGPRSMSLFIVPRSSCKNWERLDTHVLRNMVLTTYEVDGPGILVGKAGHGLQIVNRMAMPAKYICSYLGVRLATQAVRATIEHLSTKRIFGDHPINFSNVYRQMYNLVLQTSYLEFTYYRAVAFSDSSFLQFHGTMLKSWLLLRCNELMCQNLLVAGSKGFLRESVIGRNAIDSFVLPVFDGHYTLNTLLTAKMMKGYLNGTGRANLEERLHTLRRQNIFVPGTGNQMNAKSGDIRNPDFFDYADYLEQINAPVDVDGRLIISRVKDLLAEMDAKELTSSAEYKYKIGVIQHWLESILSAAELWKLVGDDYLNAIVQQYNGFVKVFNDIIAEGGLETPFLHVIHQQPIPETDDPVGYLRRLLNIEQRWQELMPAMGD